MRTQYLGSIPKVNFVTIVPPEKWDREKKVGRKSSSRILQRNQDEAGGDYFGLWLAVTMTPAAAPLLRTVKGMKGVGTVVGNRMTGTWGAG